jgi:hypothetical protein
MIASIEFRIANSVPFWNGLHRSVTDCTCLEQLKVRAALHLADLFQFQVIGICQNRVN